MISAALDQKKINLSRAVSTDFRARVPEGLDLFPFQHAGVEYAKLQSCTLFADEQGLGKTIQSIGTMNEKGIDSALILCPASLVHNWKRELERWHVGKPGVEIFHPRTFDPYAKHQIVIMPYSFAGRFDCVKKILEWGRYPLTVLDECQYLKNSKAKRTKNVLSKNGIVSKSPFIHALSGTPIVNRPAEIYPVLFRLCPESIRGMNFFQFGLKYCNGHQTRFGWDFSGASNLSELGQKLRSHLMVRRLKKEVLTELPEKFPPNLVYLDPTFEAKTLVKKMALFDADAVVNRTAKIPFEELSELRRKVGVAKIDGALEYIKTQLDAGHDKIIVFAHHREVTQKLSEGLAAYGTCFISGETESGLRQKMVDDFQNPHLVRRVFIASITAAGIGLTLTASSYVIFVEQSFVPGEMAQAVDRAHRIGQTRGVIQDYLVYEGSLDERVLKLIWQKSKVIEEIME